MAEINAVILGIISIIISITLFFLARTIIKTKLRKLKGTQKMLKLISIIIIICEIIFLSMNFDLFKFATEIIASVGVAFALVVWSLQNNLKNTVAGIGVYLNPEIDVGDVIEVEGNKGVIIELQLTRIVAMTDDGVMLYIPTLKVHEEIVRIHHKQKKDPSKTS